MKKSEKISSLTNRSLPSFCFGFIALTSNSYKSWSFPARAKLAKLSRSLNRSSRKFSLIFIYVMKIVTIYIATHTTRAILNPRVQHSVVISKTCMHACLLAEWRKKSTRSARWRKNLRPSLRKLRTPVFFLRERLLATETKYRSSISHIKF